MAATLIFESLCLASIIFMIRFLIALSRDGRTTSRCHVVHLTPRHPETEDFPDWRLRPQPHSGGAMRTPGVDSKSSPAVREWPFRRVG